MARRLVLVALVVAAVLVSAAPAMAFDGYRSDYVPSLGTTGCGICHGASPVFTDWQATAHAMVGTAAVVEDPPGTWELIATPNAEPIAEGPGCGGCHSGNYEPKLHVADPVTGFYPWENTAGDDAFTEPFIGCSACHRGLPTAHSVPKANMANADICGQCHSRYSASVEQYENYDGTFSTRQYTLGNFNPLGVAPTWTPESITAYLNIPSPTSPQSMTYYVDADGNLLPWSASGHDGGAQQYNEWAMEGHADALDGLIEDMGGRLPFLTSCLECHSADYILADEGEKPTIAEAKYGVTCQVCHDPHTQSDQTSLQNEERNPQLTMPREELCVHCHNAEIEEGEVATPGTEVHHPMKEMMEGRGAIGVPQGSPSVHKDKCVDCHMVPTAYGRRGNLQTGGNHVFAIVEPEVAAESLSTAPIGVDPDRYNRPMPASSCSSCHGRSSDPYALYLTGTFENRQAQMQAWDAEVGGELTAAAARLGYASIDEAVEAINTKGQADWNTSELAFMSAYTNRTYIESEGSWGIHNWDYARTVILKAQEQARSVKWAVTGVTISSPLVTTANGTGALKYGNSTTISGVIELPAGADSATLLGGQVRLWFKPVTSSVYQPIQQTFLSGIAYDEYLFTVMPARSGTYRVEFVGNATWAPALSETIGLKVKYRVALNRPNAKPRLNTYLRLTGAVNPIDFAAGTPVTIQRRTATGSYKNWATINVKSTGVFSKALKMKKTGKFYFRAVFAADADHLKGVSNEVLVTVRP